MKVFTLKEMYLWFLVNILLPIVVPFSFVLLMKLAVKIDKDWAGIAKMLWEGGAYIFLGLFVLLSLLPHFLETSNRISTSCTVAYAVATGIVLLVTCFLYFSLLEFVPCEVAVPYPENLPISIGVTISCVVLALIFKVYILQITKNAVRYIPNGEYSHF